MNNNFSYCFIILIIIIYYIFKIKMNDWNLYESYDNYYKILPQINDWYKESRRIKDGIKVKENFVYRSDNNSQSMTKEDLSKWIDLNMASLI